MPRPDDWSTATLRVAEERAVVEEEMRVSFQANEDYLALSAPSYPLDAAAEQVLVEQVLALTAQVNNLTRLLVPDLP